MNLRGPPISASPELGLQAYTTLDRLGVTNLGFLCLQGKHLHLYMYLKLYLYIHVSITMYVYVQITPEKHF